MTAVEWLIKEKKTRELDMFDFQIALEIEKQQRQKDFDEGVRSYKAVARRHSESKILKEIKDEYLGNNNP